MPTSLTPIILCGGSGTRLWPKSRLEKPKQFSRFGASHSLLQQTALRFQNGRRSISPQPAIIVGAERFRHEMAEQFEDCAADYQSMILEPFGMDSAPALAVSIVELSRTDPDAICCMVPSDHNISNLDGFYESLEKCVRAIEAHGWVMTIGIQPTEPETQFGYIERGDTSDVTGAYPVLRFHEKPNLVKAKEFFATGRFFWNSGIFCFRVRDMVAAFEAHDLNTWEAAQAAVDAGQRTGRELLLDGNEFSKSTKTSIDYAIMEKLDTIGVVPGAFRWNDLGGWNQIYDVTIDRDDQDNVCHGQVYTHGTSRSYIEASSRLVAVAGLEDVIVVEEEDCVLVLDRNKAGAVKELHQLMTADRRPELRSATAGISAQDALVWLRDVSVPFWAEHGIDRAHGGVFEHLHFDGSPVDDDHKRFRVLPRQIYCFAEARMMFPDHEIDFEPVLRSLFDHMVATGWHAEGGWIHRYNPDGSVQNPLRDTYDQCFVLLACASLHQATGWPEARAWADKTLNWLDANLLDETHGGYFENNERDLPRRANPHMHFLEAMLAWYDLTGEEDYLSRAEKIIGLFEKHFFNAADGVLAEMFDAQWRELPEPIHQLVEPGHHYEWAWLLLRYDRIKPTAGLREKAMRLYLHARGVGHQASGAALDFINRNGSRPDASKSTKPLDRARCWPQTEALKASVELERNGVAAAGAFRSDMLDLLFSRYLLTPLNCTRLAGENAVPGGWVDVLDDNGKSVAPYMPSSTWYHILCAIKICSEH
jgi:mannose-1-phosphate guanylyltransferase/mannose-6-phosphate isomerase